MLRILMVALVFLLIGCDSKYKSTPLKYKNLKSVDQKMYNADKFEIDLVLKKMMDENSAPFRPKEQFDEQSKFFLDTILYSPDKLRMAILIITKNGTNKLLNNNNLGKFFFNANYLFCSRSSLKSPIGIYDYSSYNIVYYTNYKDVRQRLHEYCFKELSSQNIDGKKIYNVDDLRFWHSDGFNWVMNNSRVRYVQD